MTPDGVRRLFLQALFEGDGSSSLLPRNTIQISYSTRSDMLARGVQQLLLEFGVVSRLSRYENGEIKVVVSNRRDARLFATTIGFWGRKQAKLEAELAQVPVTSTAMSSDHVPFVADFSAQLAFEHEQNLIAVFMRFGFVAGRVASLERHHCRLAALARLQHLKPFLRLRDVT